MVLWKGRLLYIYCFGLAFTFLYLESAVAASGGKCTQQSNPEICSLVWRISACINTWIFYGMHFWQFFFRGRRVLRGSVLPMWDSSSIPYNLILTSHLAPQPRLPMQAVCQCDVCSWLSMPLYVALITRISIPFAIWLNEFMIEYMVLLAKFRNIELDQCKIWPSFFFPSLWTAMCFLALMFS